MSAENGQQQPSLEKLRNANGVNSELFGYLHPTPDCSVEKLEGMYAKGNYLHCKSHKVTSGPVLSQYIPK